MDYSILQTTKHLLQKFKSFLLLPSPSCFFHHSLQFFLSWNSFTPRVVLFLVWRMLLQTKNNIDMWQRLVSGLLSHTLTTYPMTGTELTPPKLGRGISLFSLWLTYINSKSSFLTLWISIDPWWRLLQCCGFYWIPFGLTVSFYHSCKTNLLITSEEFSALWHWSNLRCV